ncbi:MAG: hypothetical protein VX181_16885 [Pseudomonadota bacterium]|nr:hypothetical protein [Pseudomonadota bacterium]
MGGFHTAKSVFQGLMVIGWMVVFFGLVLAVLALIEVGVRGFAVTTLSISFYGVLIVAAAEIGTAQITTAEKTSEILEFLRAQADPGKDH